VVQYLPVAGYAEKNEPHIFAMPRPNNCAKQNMSNFRTEDRKHRECLLLHINAYTVPYMPMNPFVLHVWADY
jgi:hypothetical protein